MRAAEHERLHDERDSNAQAATAVMRTDQGTERERYRAEHAFLHEARLQRNRDRWQRRYDRAQDVRIRQHLRRLPPAEIAIRRVVEANDHRELKRHEEITARRAAGNLLRGARFARPDAP